MFNGWTFVRPPAASAATIDIIASVGRPAGDHGAVDCTARQTQEGQCATEAGRKLHIVTLSSQFLSREIFSSEQFYAEQE